MLILCSARNFMLFYDFMPDGTPEGTIFSHKNGVIRLCSLTLRQYTSMVVKKLSRAETFANINFREWTKHFCEY